MKLRRPSVRPPPETIIALIDVVFFLLAFFMLIGRLDATAPFEVVPPVALTGADLPAGGMTISIAADGSLALDGAARTEPDLLSEVARIQGVDPALRVRLQAHQAAELRHVLPLVTAIEDLGVRDVVLVVTPNAP